MMSPAFPQKDRIVDRTGQTYSKNAIVSVVSGGLCLAAEGFIGLSHC